MLQRCVGLKIVVANRFVYHHLKRRLLKKLTIKYLSPGHNSLTELSILETIDDEYDYELITCLRQYDILANTRSKRRLPLFAPK